jgi:hypothetical protein
MVSTRYSVTALRIGTISSPARAVTSATGLLRVLNAKRERQKKRPDVKIL